MRLLEICVDTLEDAAVAIAGGANRIELCSALSVGGLTPSAGLTQSVLALARPRGVAVRAMVRPRAGDFAYDPSDLEVARAEGAALLAQGVDGLVFGAARHGALDMAALDGWLLAMRGVRGDAGFTLHRAIDVVDDLPAAAIAAADLGFDCILSSGGERRAAEGLGTLAQMQQRAGERICIMPGSGVRSDNVADILRQTGARAVHASAAAPRSASPDPRAHALGFEAEPRRSAVLDEVRALRAAMDRLP